MVRYGTVRYDTIRYGTVRYDTIRYVTVRYGKVRYDTVRASPQVRSKHRVQENLRVQRPQRLRRPHAQLHRAGPNPYPRVLQERRGGSRLAGKGVPRQQTQPGEGREAPQAARHDGLAGIHQGVLDARQDEPGRCHLVTVTR